MSHLVPLSEFNLIGAYNQRDPASNVGQHVAYNKLE
jgi:hypothetical protein